MGISIHITVQCDHCPTFVAETVELEHLAGGAERAFVDHLEGRKGWRFVYAADRSIAEVRCPQHTTPPPYPIKKE